MLHVMVGAKGDQGMDELRERVEVLSEHVARLEGILSVLLEEAENGTL